MGRAMKWAVIYNTISETNTLHVGIASRGDWKTTRELKYDDANVIDTLNLDIIKDNVQYVLNTGYNIDITSFNKEWSSDKTMLIFYGEGTDGVQRHDS